MSPLLLRPWATPQAGMITDTTGMDLREQERYWNFMRAGRQEDCHGIALHPRHLSLFERVVLKRHLAYDAEKDRDMKIQELRELYEKIEDARGKEFDKNEGSVMSDKVSQYFEWERERTEQREIRSQLANLI